MACSPMPKVGGAAAPSAPPVSTPMEQGVGKNTVSCDHCCHLQGKYLVLRSKYLGDKSVFLFSVKGEIGNGGIKQGIDNCLQLVSHSADTVRPQCAVKISKIGIPFQRTGLCPQEIDDGTVGQGDGQLLQAVNSILWLFVALTEAVSLKFARKVFDVAVSIAV